MSTNGGTKETSEINNVIVSLIILSIATIISHRERTSIKISVISVPVLASREF